MIVPLLLGLGIFTFLGKSAKQAQSCPDDDCSTKRAQSWCVWQLWLNGFQTLEWVTWPALDVDPSDYPKRDAEAVQRAKLFHPPTDSPSETANLVQVVRRCQPNRCATTADPWLCWDADGPPVVVGDYWTEAIPVA